MLALRHGPAPGQALYTGRAASLDIEVDDHGPE
ncbi:MAG: hypothetical protein AVDCRST_MAG25-2752, partial [uncultured Rubrobacteraceae bacterium]